MSLIDYSQSERGRDCAGGTYPAWLAWLFVGSRLPAGAGFRYTGGIANSTAPDLFASLAADAALAALCAAIGLE